MPPTLYPSDVSPHEKIDTLSPNIKLAPSLTLLKELSLTVLEFTVILFTADILFVDISVFTLVPNVFVLR